jgi:prepilin-type N-terminal cleavage/methylation domain-containing protein
MSRQRKSQAGFTIVELMIATLVFAVVLILITVGVLTFTRSFFKGINQSRTQNAARTVIETISQGIQFSGGEVNGSLTVSATSVTAS